MPAHSYKHRVDAVITARGCDPFYLAPGDICIYRLSDDSRGGGPYISTWSPPDSTYGDAPTAAEIAAVSEAEAEAAATLRRQTAAQRRLDDDPMLVAILDAVAEVAEIDADALKAATVARLS